MNDDSASYKINGTNCFQRFVCKKVKNVANRNSAHNKLNNLIVQIAYSNWAECLLAGTAIKYAIKMARLQKHWSSEVNEFKSNETSPSSLGFCWFIGV